MTLTNLQKAEAERISIETTIFTLEQAITDHATTSLDVTAVDLFLKMATSTQTKLFENLDKIMMCSPSDPAPYQADFAVLLRRVVSAHSGLHGIKMSFPNTTTTSTPLPTGKPHQEVRLPKLEIPQFQGDISQWITFRDMFLATVHNKASLSKIEKLTYLKSLVSGEAARQLQDIILSDANYDIAWTALTDRYNNERELLFTISRKLFYQQTISNASAAAIRQLLDTTRSCLRSLDTLRIKTDECGPIILFIVFSKLDNITKELWLQSLKSKAIPDMGELFTFLEQRATSMISGNPTSTVSRSRNPQGATNQTRTHHIQSKPACAAGCSTPHRLFHCPEFMKWQVTQRIQFLKNQSICNNCLSHSSDSVCKSTGTCKTCGQKHNTLLHLAKSAHTVSTQEASTSSGGSSKVTSHIGNSSAESTSTLLATALVKVEGKYGPELRRALLDSGSETSLITDSFAKQLRLSIQPSSIEVVGLSSTSVGETIGTVTFNIKPHFSSEATYTVNALVIQKITNKLPPTKLSAVSWPHLHNIELADPQFYNPKNIDLLIGADLFWSLIRPERLHGDNTSPVAINSTLGWIVSGQISSNERVSVHSLITNIQLNQQLERFWSTEEIPTGSNNLTPEEHQCESIFQNTHSRLEDGRYMVHIPWKDNVNKIGESRKHAVRRLLNMEKRLKNAPEHKSEYVKFMKEYEDLHHMTKIPPEEIFNSNNPTYYIPHHFVLKHDSTTTKFRVVFDGSAKSSTNLSVNDCMMTGATIQSSLFDIVLRFRLNAIAFTSDIAKMYRQIQIPKVQQDLQRIVWRENETQEVQDYRLTTVSYGLSSSAFLATRCLLHLAETEGKIFPLAAPLIKRDCYVDDLQSGCDTVTQGIEAVKQIIELGNSAGFPFRKWSCNNKQVLASVPEDLRENNSLIPIDDEELVKTLGIFWNPRDDSYQFKVTVPDVNPNAITKRQILAETSKLFDPMGWLAPMTISAKILIQDIWKESLEWDENVPFRIQQQWLLYNEQLKFIEAISLPRYFPHNECETVELVGFSDASEKAYAAVVYLCGTKSNGDFSVSLLTAKTRVAPIHGVTLPRLELNAAVLLSELMTTVDRALHIKVNRIRAFTDSTIVLGWITSDPNRWKTYVKNRVSKIQMQFPSDIWAHVPGKENPADCASRGLLGEDLIHHKLWWECNQNIIRASPFPVNIDMSPVQQEERRQVLTTTQFKQLDFRFLSYYSSIRKMTKFLAIVIRAQRNYKARKIQASLQTGPFGVGELENALMEIIKCVQTNSFGFEMSVLREDGKGQLPKRNSILPLDPFVDSTDILRVGGRLKHARISLSQRHPILLPRKHHITKLIILDVHHQNFHCGPQQTLSLLNMKYWVVSARDVVRMTLRTCTICTRHRGITMVQKMGNLPEARVNPARPFIKVGVDYAGPFSLKNFGRSKVTFKVYLSVFVCLVTKALHLEVVSSLSTDAFLAALRRFSSRRGRPTDVFSDCATNFRGADRQLRELHQFQRKNEDVLINRAAEDGIKFHRSASGSPHMNGLWEAGVKSIKYHLKRVIGPSQLTYEEFITLVTQIEGVLNSRPLTTIPTDPNEIKVLTAGHFLIGDIIAGIPQHDLSDVKIGRLDRWQFIQQKQQSFWKRWSSEYINRMQQRPKWMQKAKQIQLDDIVIIKDENQPPGKWRLGRVTATHPGDDGIIRVVTLKTQNGEIKRPIVKLCILNNHENI